MVKTVLLPHLGVNDFMNANLGKKVEMFFNSQIVIEYVVLRTEAELWVHPVDVPADVVTIHDRCSTCRWEEPRQYRKGGGLPCAVMAEQRSDLSLIHVQAHVLHGHFVPFVNLSMDKKKPMDVNRY